jgi:hypothetical protein
MEIRKPNLDVMNRFGDIIEREVNENVIRSVQKKNEKEQEQCLETVYVISAARRALKLVARALKAFL